MSSKIEELLKVRDKSKDEQQEWWEKNYGADGGCCSCENCLEYMAFRLSNGKIAGKKPIEYIIDVLIKRLDDDSE